MCFDKKRTKVRRNTLKIILDTDKKTTTVPWNYTMKHSDTQPKTGTKPAKAGK